MHRVFVVFVAPFACVLAACGGSGMDPDDTEGTATQALDLVQFVDFDKDPSGVAILDGTVIDSVYSSLGVTFSAIYCGNTPTCSAAFAYARAPGNPTNGVSLFSTGYSGFDSRWGAIDAKFSTAVTRVSIDVLGTNFVEGLGTPTAKPWLAAYDASNNFLSIVYGTTSPNTWQTLTITGAAIGKVRFSSQASEPWVYSNFDNLTFEVPGPAFTFDHWIFDRPIPRRPGRPFGP